MKHRLIIAAAVALCLSVCGSGWAQPASAPLASAVSAERLSRLHGFIEQATRSGGYLGAVTLIVHRDRIVDLRAHGHRDLARREAMAPDAIFRIYSMSKTVAAIAALMLVEEGRLNLDDPVARHLPEFAALQVLAGGSADAPQLRAPRRPLTLRHLLTHTAGFGTGGEGIEVASELLRRAHPHGAADLRDFASRVARVPLAIDPGSRFRYDGVQIEVLGRVIEVASGVPLAAFLQQRLFGPLKMVDTGFEVPPAQRRRVVDISTMGPQGQLVLAPGPSAANPGAPLNRYPSGAGGLYSTASDFARLCRMLLAQGTLDGVTILGRKTVETMLDNHLWQTDPAGGLPPSRFTLAEGFGLGGSVVVDAAQRGRLTSLGAFGWSGAASTYFTIDPKEQLAAILLMQHLHSEPTGVPDLPKLSNPFYNLVYQALIP